MTDFFSSNVNFLLVTTENKPFNSKDLQLIESLLHRFKLINSAVVHQPNSRGPIELMTYDLTKRRLQKHREGSDVDIIFPDRSRNLNGYQFKAISVHIGGVNELFMKTAVKLQNASLSLKIVRVDLPDSTKQFFDMMVTQVDLSLSHVKLIERISRLFKPVFTFESDGFCALVPIPQRISYLRYILTPFDQNIWICFLTSTGISFVIWKIYRKLTKNVVDSAAYFIFGIIANFFLQDIPFHQNVPTLKALYQTFVFAMIVIGNIYQSLIISTITQPHYEPKFRVIDELFQGGFNFKVDSQIMATMSLSNVHQNIKWSMLEYSDLKPGSDYKKRAMNNTVYIIKCEIADLMMSQKRIQQWNLNSYYYIVPERFYTVYETFMTARFSPFHQMWNNLSLYVFESGIRQHWRTILDKELLGSANQNPTEEDDFLEFSDLKGVFIVLLCCLLVSFFVFMLELSKPIICNLILSPMNSLRNYRIRRNRVHHI